MPYQLFHDLFPEIAEPETRTLTVFGNRSKTGLPPGQYAFCEMFCNERACDCRRVFFYVVASSRKGPEAVIAWGWESPEFYANWLHDDDPEMIAELIGPSLNLGSPQTELADSLLDLAHDVLLGDEAYVERVKRHYRLFRARIDGESPASSRGKKNRKRKA
ncbi:MAG: hypothetical protein ABIF82_15020 [Planctomycetota bacterium]